MPRVIGSTTKFEKFKRSPDHAIVPTVRTTPAKIENSAEAERPNERKLKAHTNTSAHIAIIVARGPSVSIAETMSLESNSGPAASTEDPPFPAARRRSDVYSSMRRASQVPVVSLG